MNINHKILEIQVRAFATQDAAEAYQADAMAAAEAGDVREVVRLYELAGRKIGEAEILIEWAQWLIDEFDLLDN